MSGGNAELLEVQEKLKVLNADYDKLNDEWTGRLAAQNDEFQREKHVRISIRASAPFTLERACCILYTRVHSVKHVTWSIVGYSNFCSLWLGQIRPGSSLVGTLKRTTTNM